MKKLLFVIPVALMACKKEEPQPTQGCNCYKAYEQLTQGVWNPYYDTPEELKPCEVNGTTTYEGGNVRYTWVCQ